MCQRGSFARLRHRHPLQRRQVQQRWHLVDRQRPRQQVALTEVDAQAALGLPAGLLVIAAAQGVAVETLLEPLLAATPPGAMGLTLQPY